MMRFVSLLFVEPLNSFRLNFLLAVLVLKVCGETVVNFNFGGMFGDMADMPSLPSSPGMPTGHPPMSSDHVGPGVLEFIIIKLSSFYGAQSNPV